MIRHNSSEWVRICVIDRAGADDIVNDRHADEGAERIQKETTICYSGASSYAQNQGVEHDGEHASAR